MNSGTSGLWSGRRLHFVGVGGCGMSGLALVAHQLGAEVSGSDVKPSVFTESLAACGVSAVRLDHAPSNVPTAGEVVYSAAIRPDNVERVRARELGLGELHRSELIAQLTRVRRTVAVAGAHGKSSTSALIAHILGCCGLEPSYIVGALLRPPGLHAAAGAGEVLVIEADESDRSLLHYDVDIAVVTNVDLDHVGDAGRYSTVEDVGATLDRFAGRASRTVATEQAAGYLASVGGVLDVVEPKVVGESLARFWLDGAEYEINQPGRHNIANAALAVRVARLLGCVPMQIAAALATFPGLVRRFELRGRTGAGARVFDDYAHHPAEIAAVLDTARHACRDGRVLAVFQPHLFSRTAQFTEEFASALAAADRAWVEPIYPARERPQDWEHVTSQNVVDAAQRAGHTHVTASENRERLAAELVDLARAEDVIVLVGAGDVTRIAGLLVG